MPESVPENPLGGGFCLNCGTNTPGGVNFCPQCGFRLAHRNSGPAPAAQRGTVLAPVAVEYMGFWIRAAASLIDALLMGMMLTIAARMLAGLPGLAGLVEGLLPLLYLVVAVVMRSETPGKKVLRLQVVDDRGSTPGFWRTVARELVGKFLSGIFLGLGFLWAAWDGRKRGWHDYLAGTYVVRTHRRPTAA